MKITYHYVPLKLGNIINDEKLTDSLELEFRQNDWLEDKEYVFTVKDRETISDIIDYFKNKKVRRYAGFWSNRVRYDAEGYAIYFKNTTTSIYIIGTQYIEVSTAEKGWARYEFIEKLDLTPFRKIIDNKIKELDNETH